jgi:hypothetical protein
MSRQVKNVEEMEISVIEPPEADEGIVPDQKLYNLEFFHNHFPIK